MQCDEFDNKWETSARFYTDAAHELTNDQTQESANQEAFLLRVLRTQFQQCAGIQSGNSKGENHDHYVLQRRDHHGS